MNDLPEAGTLSSPGRVACRKSRRAFWAGLSIYLVTFCLVASSAAALVTIRHRLTGPVGTVGDTIEVDITLENDGLTPLTGVFVSASWDESVLQLQGTPSADLFAVFSGPTGFLARIASPRVFPGDPPGTFRTIQYGAGPGQSVGAGDEVTITTLTFLIIGAGLVTVDLFENTGDMILGPGFQPLPESSICFIGFVSSVADEVPLSGLETRSAGCPPVPEPGTGLLVGVGLVMLGISRRLVPLT